MAEKKPCPHDKVNNFSRRKNNNDGTEDRWTERVCLECNEVLATGSVKTVKVHDPSVGRKRSGQNRRGFFKRNRD